MEARRHTDTDQVVMHHQSVCNSSDIWNIYTLKMDDLRKLNDTIAVRGLEL